MLRPHSSTFVTRAHPNMVINVYDASIAFSGITIYTAWKNNSVTAPAKMGDKIMTAIKNGEVTLEAVDELLNAAKETLDKDE